MEKYLKIWKSANDFLTQILNRTQRQIGNIKIELKNSEKNISNMIIEMNSSYMENDDKKYIIENINECESNTYRDQKLKSDLVIFKSSPIWKKIETNRDVFYLSKTKSNYDFESTKNNIVLWTTEIAKLRFGEIGEVRKIKGIEYLIKEKESYTTKDGKLKILRHYDLKENFEYDGNTLRILPSQFDQYDNKIEITKENLSTSSDQKLSIESQLTSGEKREGIAKKHVLGEIIEQMKEEQDTIMRAPIDGITLIKGVAGSGKTNIAFHRIVYLLNEFPNRFDESNIAVFCFNVSLKKYLKNLTEGLNIPLIKTKTFSFDKWLNDIICNLSNISSIDYHSPQPIDLLKIKTKKDIIQLIKAFLNEKINTILKSLINDEYLVEYLHKDLENLKRTLTGSSRISLKNFISLRNRFKDKIEKNRFFKFSKTPNEITKDEFKKIQDKLHKIIIEHYCTSWYWDGQCVFDGVKLLNEFYKFNGFKTYCSTNNVKSNSQITNKVSQYDRDILGYMLNVLSKGLDNKISSLFDHIVVDEVQDFSPIQMALINNLHNNSMTLAGDVNQKIFDQGINSWDEYDFKIRNEYELKMCHRATLETMLFANNIKQIFDTPKDKSINKVGKRGKKPSIVKCDSSDHILSNILYKIEEIKIADMTASCVIVAPRKKELERINKVFTKKGINAYIANRYSWKFSEDIAITTYKQIKGLEFDYVFMIGINDFIEWDSHNKENVLYTVITRAREKVFIYYKNVMPILHKLDKELYDFENNLSKFEMMKEKVYTTDFRLTNHIFPPKTPF